MFTVDIHCDALMKMSEVGNYSFAEDSNAIVNKTTLQKGKIDIQNFALFATPRKSLKDQKKQIKKQLKIFHDSIAQDPMINHRPFRPLPRRKLSKTNAILSLEGAGAFAEDTKEWNWLKSQGVEMISLTWNEKNKLAAGSCQSNKYGLTTIGGYFVEWMNRNNIVVDAAHLNERSFWDVLEKAERIVVSHANIYSLSNHNRNLKDDQIKGLIQKKGFLGLTFYPLFLNGTNTASFSDIARQIDYLGSLNVLHATGFGSDFDGINTSVDGLRSPEDIPKLIDWLLKYFDDDIILGICGLNFVRYWNSLRHRDNSVC